MLLTRTFRGNKDSLIRLAACAVLVFALDAVAQPTPRNLTGTVMDRHSEPLAGAVVQVHDENTDSVVSFITTRTGKYSFRRLSSDDNYTVVAVYRGFRSKSRYLSRFDSKSDRDITLVVKMP